MATVSADGPDAKKGKPERPDDEAFKTNVAKAEKDHAASMERLNAVKAKLDLAKPPSKGSPSPVQQRQQELRAELSSIRQQQQGLKSSKGNLQEKIRQLDANLKSCIAEHKNARGKIPYKSVEEVDREIQRLEKQVDSGTMKLVEEKKALADVSSLRKQRKGFAAFDEQQKGIDDIKAQTAELRKGLEDPEAKALSERYSTIAKELDGIKAEQDAAYKDINALRDERSKLQAEQQEKYGAIRTIKDGYYSQKKAYSNYEHEAYLARKEKQRSEKDAFERERRKKAAEQRLEEASAKAYIDEILTAEGLIRYFDPSAAGTALPSAEQSKYAAQASRTVDGSDLKGTLMKKKDDGEENYFMGTGSKKGKKGRKGGSAVGQGGVPPETGRFNLSIGIIEELGKVNVEPPMSQADVPATVEKLQKKVAHWKEDSDRQTKQNVEKAQREIERLEAEASAHSPSVTANASEDQRTKSAPRKPAMVNGEAEKPPSGDAALALEKDAAADVTEDMKKAKLEDRGD